MIIEISFHSCYQTCKRTAITVVLITFIEVIGVCLLSKIVTGGF
jgi:hypothetical protein